MDGTTVAGEVNEDGVTLVDVGIIDEVRHEVILDGPLGRLAVREEAYLISGNIEVVCQPPLDTLSIIDAGLEIPDVAGLIFINSWNRRMNGFL